MDTPLLEQAWVPDPDGPAGGLSPLPVAGQPKVDQWFATEVQPHEPLLRRWLRARFPSLTERDDLVQESFLRVLRARDVGPIDNVRPFLLATARNLALNQLRHRQHTHPEGLREIDASRVLDEQADTPAAVARREEIELLHEAIESLPVRCREVFTLRRIYGLSQKEVAARLSISEKTVENQTLLALQRCQEYFCMRDAFVAHTGRRPSSVPAATRSVPMSAPEVRHA